MRPVHCFVSVLCEQNEAVLMPITKRYATAIFFSLSQTLKLSFLLSLNYLGSMPSMLVVAPSESSSMLCTYPQTTKPSKQRRKGTQKPISRTSLNHSPLFFLHSSESPLRCGHRCHRCGSSHSPVRVIKIKMLSDLLV